MKVKKLFNFIIDPENYYCLLAKAEAFLVIYKPEESLELINHALQYQNNWPKVFL